VRSRSVRRRPRTPRSIALRATGQCTSTSCLDKSRSISRELKPAVAGMRLRLIVSKPRLHAMRKRPLCSRLVGEIPRQRHTAPPWPCAKDVGVIELEAIDAVTVHLHRRRPTIRKGHAS
jgi:hypothetical protein